MNIYDLDTSIDTLRAILWQYNDADTLQALARSKQRWYEKNHTIFWQNWIRDVFDLRTANDFGLDVWAIILGVKTSFSMSPTGKKNFGFGEFNFNFNRGNFGRTGSGTKALTREQKRLIIRMRYFNLISRSTITEINRFLAYAFRDYGTRVFVVDDNKMDYAVYVFRDLPDSDVQFVIDNFDILPRPAAVGLKVLIHKRDRFGFGRFNKNFNLSTFS
ncbi:MAG: DUF2612 domain-containing protein [Candidatus Accumulibacter sp.]|jgi:hypothetical protein|nr:DUF2612 domain-containing protein [Accumulibacter sp.]